MFKSAPDASSRRAGQAAVHSGEEQVEPAVGQVGRAVGTGLGMVDRAGAQALAASAHVVAWAAVAGAAGTSDALGDTEAEPLACNAGHAAVAACTVLGTGAGVQGAWLTGAEAAAERSADSPAPAYEP